MFLQEMFKRGILLLGTHNISVSHSDKDIARLLDTYHDVFPIIKTAVNERKLERMLKVAPLKPLFQVR